jgi:hypothetical protein
VQELLEAERKLGEAVGILRYWKGGEEARRTKDEERARN